MASSRMKKVKKYLFFKPKKCPKWWPKEGRKYAFVGALKDGTGWQVGRGDKLTDAEIRFAKKMLKMDWNVVEFKTEKA